VLVILFPVISATDDLMAMRTEMEESPISKRSVHQTGHDKVSVSNIRLQVLPALPAMPISVAPTAEFSSLSLSVSIFVPVTTSVLPSGRAPPVSCLA